MALVFLVVAFKEYAVFHCSGNIYIEALSSAADECSVLLFPGGIPHLQQCRALQPLSAGQAGAYHSLQNFARDPFLDLEVATKKCDA